MVINNGSYSFYIPHRSYNGWTMYITGWLIAIMDDLLYDLWIMGD